MYIRPGPHRWNYNKFKYMAYKFKNGIDVSSAGFYVGTTKGSSSQVITGDGKLVAKSSFIGPTGPDRPGRSHWSRW
jgi:hypothetical protein